MKRLSKTALAFLAASISSAAFAQASEPWEGTWNTDYGPLELVQDGRFVYGDYRNDAVFEGVTDPSGWTLRAKFTYPDGRTGFAMLALPQNSDRQFSGRWNWSSKAPPVSIKARGAGTWSGTKSSGTRPRINHFPYSPSPRALYQRTPSANQDWLFYGGNYTAIARSGGSGTSSASTTSASAARLSHIPAFADFPADYRPRYVEFELDMVQLKERGNLIGTARAYAKCETARGSKFLPVFGNQSNTIFSRNKDSPRKSVINPSRNVGTKRFVIDQDCLEDRNSRIKLELRFDMANHRKVGRDKRFGARTVGIYLDQLPRLGESGRSEFIIEGTRKGVWNWSQWIAQDQKIVFRIFDAFLILNGDIRLVE